jgi:hypothetical protein
MIMKTRTSADKFKLTPDDFYLDESGNLIINIEKVMQVLNYQAVKVKKDLPKSGVSPI